MRSGSGRIFNKLTNKPNGECLSEITNNLHSKSQVNSEKADRLTQLGSSICSRHSSRSESVENLELIFSRRTELEAEGKMEDPGSIVRKLTCLNNIFKELKLLK